MKGRFVVEVSQIFTQNGGKLYEPMWHKKKMQLPIDKFPSRVATAQQNRMQKKSCVAKFVLRYTWDLRSKGLRCTKV